MNKKEIFEYLHTIAVALLVALFLAGAATGCSKIIAEHHSRMLAKISNTTKDNEMIAYLISVYTEKAKEHPGDYSINVRLGNLNELIFNYHEAEAQYKKAIAKSPYGVYSSYLGLANLYIKQNKFKKAMEIVKSLKNTDHKPLLIAKGDFYMNLGDALWQNAKYEEAVNQYKVAFFFYKKVSSDKKQSAISGIIDCYNKIADESYKNKKINKAIKSLETALLYKEAPILQYKLAILYKNIDPILANEYIEKAYKKDPGLINFDIYEEILYSLIRIYYEAGNDIEMDLYKHKLKSIKNFQKRYVINENDIKINIEKLKLKKNLFGTKYILDIAYEIENNSKYDINTLFFNMKIRYDDNAKIVQENKYFSKNKPLKSRETSELFHFHYEFTDKDDLFLAKNLWLEFYASKKENMRKVPILSVEIKQ